MYSLFKVVARRKTHSSVKIGWAFEIEMKIVSQPAAVPPPPPKSRIYEMFKLIFLLLFPLFLRPCRHWATVTNSRLIKRNMY